MTTLPTDPSGRLPGSIYPVTGFYDSFISSTLQTDALCSKRSNVRLFGKTETMMAGGTIPHFQNDAGHRVIEIGVKEFMCVGANPPFDHPHIFIDMGDEDEAVCSYCSTLYRYSPKLKATETVPQGCLYIDRAA
jgi:uncharacterized Zn-finger protein